MSAHGANVPRVRRAPHENVATVLVDPRVLADLELALMGLDLPVWPIRTAPICEDGPRTAFQVRHRLLERHRGAWDLAADWTPVWIGFGASWHHGAEPLPLSAYADHVRFHRRLGGVARLTVPQDAHS